MDSDLALPTVPKKRDVAKWTKFWATLTAFFLSAAALTALASGIEERTNLRHELADQTAELSCRNAASVAVTKAIANEENLIAEALVYVADGNGGELAKITLKLKAAIDNVNTAIKQAEEAQKGCIPK